MKKILLLLTGCAFFFTAKAQVSVTVFEDILFYDGYAALVDLGTHPVPDGVIRHRNDLYAKKLSADQLAAFGSNMTINVTIKAACDNYDRIGNVNLAFVPTGSTAYNPAEVEHIELARFITPFMNKNIEPTQVPYTFSADNVAKIFKDPAILADYDIWVEFEVFGVPYAAQEQVAGCAGRIDVFYGTLEFVSNADTFSADDNFLLPMNFKKNLNNYEVGATDAIGTTERTIVFTAPSDISEATFVLITSNHGSNPGGEEYNRRWHRVFYDGALKLLYKPGGVSCEPYRQYNTQGNGIYGATPRTDAEWASFSNWCPGQVIPIRTVPIGDMPAGDHTFKITVAGAQFVGQQGYIPVSLYLQGNAGELAVDDFDMMSYNLYPNPTENFIAVQSSSAVRHFTVYNMIGQRMLQGQSAQIDLGGFSKGVYLVEIEFENHRKVTEKVIRK
ncbi:peptide-N-glycosidase F-related protein [Flavobacterium sp.]|uniref:peptide-N-glycosidase F-related protein n=1 Tax=Flavobacterium sp. TaxID=239 RepID=UPI0039E6DC3A